VKFGEKRTINDKICVKMECHERTRTRDEVRDNHRCRFSSLDGLLVALRIGFFCGCLLDCTALHCTLHCTSVTGLLFLVQGTSRNPEEGGFRASRLTFGLPQ
jgi:hypothetical protein